jgi:hypothetical protein
MRRFALLVCVLSLAGVTAPVSAQVPSTFTNLKVLPKEIGQRALVEIMRGFVFALDVRCQFCHVGEEGADLSTFDFASDVKPTKTTARKMMTMLVDVNRAVAGIGEPSTEPKITCYTCHRGARKPATRGESGSRF